MLYRTRCPFATTYFSYKCCYFQILQPCIGMNMVTYPVCHWWIDNNKSATEGLSHTKLVYMSIKGWTSWVWPPWIGFSQINSNTLPMLCPIQLPNWGITHTDLVFVSWESFPGFKGHVGKSFHQCPQDFALLRCTNLSHLMICGKMLGCPGSWNTSGRTSTWKCRLAGKSIFFPKWKPRCLQLNSRLQLYKIWAAPHNFNTVLTQRFEIQVFIHRKPVKKSVGIENPKKPRRQPVPTRRLLRKFT